MTKDKQHLLELIERLHQLRGVLKSGEYDGADLMRAWCAMIDAAEAIQSLHDVLEEWLEAVGPEQVKRARLKARTLLGEDR